MMSEEELEAVVIRDGNVTAVHITIELPPDGRRTLHGTGTARRHPDDRPDERTGTALAYARALADVARQAQVVAEDRIAGKHLVRPLSARAMSEQIDALQRLWAGYRVRAEPDPMHWLFTDPA